MKTRDVTDQMTLGMIDDEHLVIDKCACGAKFAMWNFDISIYPESPQACPACHRRFYHKVVVTVYEVIEE